MKMTFVEALVEATKDYCAADAEFGDDPLTVMSEDGGQTFVIGVQLYDAHSGLKTTFVGIACVVQADDGGWKVGE